MSEIKITQRANVEVLTISFGCGLEIRNRELINIGLKCSTHRGVEQQTFGDTE